jgi:hypothetical protein
MQQALLRTPGVRTSGCSHGHIIPGFACALGLQKKMNRSRSHAIAGSVLFVLAAVGLCHRFVPHCLKLPCGFPSLMCISPFILKGAVVSDSPTMQRIEKSDLSVDQDAPGCPSWLLRASWTCRHINFLDITARSTLKERRSSVAL